MQRKYPLFFKIYSFLIEKIQWRQIYFWWPLFFLSCSSSVPELINTPTLIRNPNEAAPLVTYLQFTADEPVRAEIEIYDGDKKRWLYQPQGLFKQEQAIPLFQFNPSKEYQIKLRIKDTRNNISKQTGVIKYRTPDLPKAFPKLQLIQTAPEKREPGYTILSLARPKGEGSGAYLIALNRQAEVAWYFQYPESLGLLKRSRRGNILTNNQKNLILELDLTGKILERYSNEKHQKGLDLFFQKNNALSTRGEARFLSQKLASTQNILKAKSQENSKAYTRIEEWTAAPNAEKIFELEIADEFEIQGILHLPDLLVSLDGS